MVFIFLMYSGYRVSSPPSADSSRYSVFGREVVEDVVLAGQKTWHFARRNDRSVGSDLTGERRDHLVRIEDPARFANVRRRQVRGDR